MAERQTPPRQAPTGKGRPAEKPAAGRNKIEKSTKKRKRRLSRFHLVVILFVSIVVLSCAIAFLLLSTPERSADGTIEKPAVFAVKSVVVAGETRYSREAIAGISGIRVGQSIFSVNKREASEKIREAFPYIDYINIGNTAFDTITITVREVDVIGARYAQGGWIVVGSNGRALEALPLEGDRPPRYLYFKGATPAEVTVGGDAMDERSWQIVEAMLQALEATAVPDADGKEKTDLSAGVSEIDMTDKSDILLNWNNQISIAIGNERDLKHKANMAAVTIPSILRERGNTIRGLLNMRSYSDNDPNNNIAVFTPEELLKNSGG